MSDVSASLIDAAQMQVLLKIVETRSFTNAAAAFGVSQPSISQQVKRIESRVGRPLFRRRNSGVELTSDGEAVVVYARAMLSLDKDLRSQLARNLGRFRVSIGMPQDVCRTALSSVLLLFARHHPEVEVQVVSGTYTSLTKAIETRCIDLAIVRRDALFPNLQHLWKDTQTWVGPPDFRSLGGSAIPLVVPTDPSPARDVAINALKAAGRSWRIAFESDDLASLEAALQARLGVTASPCGMRHYGAVRLDAASGLPALPSVEFAMSEPLPDADANVRALAAVIRAVAGTGFGRPAPRMSQS